MPQGFCRVDYRQVLSKSDYSTSLNPFSIIISPKATMKTALSFGKYRFSFSGIMPPMELNSIINGTVPSANISIESAPETKLPVLTAYAHIAASAPQGMRLLRSPITNGFNTGVLSDLIGQNATGSA